MKEHERSERARQSEIEEQRAAEQKKLEAFQTREQ